ncbi:MAG TPA: tRNA pseudouridine(55) synthase TruB [Phenylobacterium sp.]|uniref:tRNA pseudouridine(55) synthase TruB n=1 Tax=Phenylobacterium sp. TaxID=1871053 RepID=UPI002CD5F2E8|nr:tRNA pseudouridine(55) synthase TruB [Phenylobacterium sp.]HSV03632.1 tRNA pseudouridine(55) synthase TruB [Phenylobacterium sp.]
MGRRRKGDPVSGWINLDKPYDLTSTHAVGRVRWIFNAQKAGHAGTLDPLATGILPIALGEATKTVPFLMEADKVYRFTLAWGRTTATFDSEGPVVAESDVRPDPDLVASVLPRFVGEISQVPPAYSAIKVAGERAYDLARAGQTVALEARPVVIHAARVVHAPDPDRVVLEIECGKGTYVRALVRDIAAALGACGHVSELRRTRVGAFTEQSAVTLEHLQDLGHKARQSEALLPVETALDDIPALAVTDEDAFRLKQGRSIVLVPRQVEAVKARLKPGSRTVSAMAGGSVVALCEMRAGRLEPSRVFHLEKSGDRPDVDYGRTQG